MLRTKTDYTKGSIYKIVCRDNNITDYYVGSTTNLTSRKSSHHLRCINENDPKHHYQVYKFIRDTGGWDNWNFVLTEHFSCKDNDELRAREQHFYGLLNSTLNLRAPLTTKEQTKQKQAKWNAEHTVEKRQWRTDNKVIIKANKQKYYLDNKHG